MLFSTSVCFYQPVGLGILARLVWGCTVEGGEANYREMMCALKYSLEGCRNEVSPKGFFIVNAFERELLR